MINTRHPCWALISLRFHLRYPGAGNVEVGLALELEEKLEKLAEEVDETTEDENDCTASSCAVSGSGGMK